MRRPTGLTLIELLVVLLVVGLLLAVLMPALAAAWASARDLQCRSNLRQLMAGQMTYELDHGKLTPHWTAEDPVGWRRRLSDHMGLERSHPRHDLFHCSLADRLEPAGEAELAGPFAPASIGLNGHMRFPAWEHRLEAPPAPSRIIALGDQPVDRLESLLTADGYGVWAQGERAGWWWAPNHAPADAYRHGGGRLANFAFMDGHVAGLEHAALLRDAGHWFWWEAEPYEEPGDDLPADLVIVCGCTPGPF